VLAVFWLRAASLEMWVVDSYVLLELLEGVVRPLRKTVEAVVHVPVGNMAIRQQGGGGDGVVRGEAVEWIGKHLDGG
jgi:hypothetical protein